MNTLVDKPIKALHREGRIYVSMASGLDFSFPTEGNPKLEGSRRHRSQKLKFRLLDCIGLTWMKTSRSVEFSLVTTASGKTSKRLRPGKRFHAGQDQTGVLKVVIPTFAGTR